MTLCLYVSMSVKCHILQRYITYLPIKHISKLQKMQITQSLQYNISK